MLKAQRIELPNVKMRRVVFSPLSDVLMRHDYSIVAVRSKDVVFSLHACESA
jgi:hypothetical protein